MKDQILLENLYQQILIVEKSSLTNYGFSKPFIKALHDRFNVPHDATLTQINKLPTKDQFLQNYSFVVFKTKDNEEIFIYRYITDLHDYALSEDQSRLESICIDYGKMKGRANKETIFACPNNIEIKEREYVKRDKYNKLTQETFELMHSKFGERFIKEIESIKDFIYDNIRHFKTLGDRHNRSELEEVADLISSLENLKIADSYIAQREYNQIVKNVMQTINYENEQFIKKFEENPSYTSLAYMYLQLIKDIKNDVLLIYYADELKQYPEHERREKLKDLIKLDKLKQKLPELEGLI